MLFGLLGPLEVTDGNLPVRLGEGRQRGVLVLLLLHRNEAVSSDRLIDALWGESPPPTAAKVLQNYVGHLRRALGDREGRRLETRGRSYALRVDDGELDLDRFERLAHQGADALDHGQAADAADRLREALALWRGPPLADVAYEAFAQSEIARLQERRTAVLEQRIEADLALGHHADLVAELEPLVVEHPLRERLREQRMLALYRSGRQADALAAYQETRRTLLDELGVEPGPALSELQEAILRHDPELAPQPRARPRVVRRGRRAPALLAAGGVVLVAAAALAISRSTGVDRLSGIDEGAVGTIDPRGANIVSQYRIGPEPGAVAAGARSVWAALPRQGTVSRIHGEGDRVDTIDVGPAPAALAFGAGYLWVAGGEDGAVRQVDPAVNRVVQRIRVGNGLRAVAVGHGAVWAAAALDGEVVRIDLRSGRVTNRIAVGGHPAALAMSQGAVWAAGDESGTVARIDARTAEIVDAIAVGNGPSALAVGLGAVWTANRQDGTVSRIDPKTDRVTDTVRAGRAPVALAIAGGALWVADATGAVARLDPRTRRISHAVRTGTSLAGLVAADGALWATAVAPPAAHRGGTLRVGISPAIHLDPTFGGYLPNARWVAELAYEGLLAHRRASGAAGGQLVGALASDVPKPVDAGRRYVFRLRLGLRYSDGTPVRARDVRRSMERALVGAGDLLGPTFDAIEGAARCRATPRRCDLTRGIVTDDRVGTVTIHLRRPDPDLLEKLTLVAVLPSATPRRPFEPGVPTGTGPYRVAKLAPGRTALLTRNPYFRARGPDGRAAGFADRIEVTMGQEGAQIAAAERGRLDIISPFATITANKLAALRTRIGTRLQSGTVAQTMYAWLNVKAPPFDDPRVRRALNLAVDRGRAVDMTGGPDAGSPTCQLLPPGLPGHRPTCSFTVAPSPAGAWTAPDRAEAERLVAAAGTHNTTGEVWTSPWLRTVGRHVTNVLRDLGFHSRLRVFDELRQIYEAAVDPQQRPQIGLTGWVADFAEPAGFLRPLVSCDAYAPDDSASTNLSRFCDPRIDAAIDRAEAAGPTGGAAWQKIERRIAAKAPVVPLFNPRWVVVTSPRVGNVLVHPLTGVLLDQVWVR